MSCERCDEPAFPGRGFCADHLLESLGLEFDDPGDMERGMNRECVARRRDGERCRDRCADRATKLCADHQKLLDGGAHFEDLLRGDVDLPEDRKKDDRRRSGSKLSPARRVKAVLAEEGIGNGAEPAVADVDVSAEEHERVAATVGDILRDARTSSREVIEETVALLLDARRTVKVVVPPGEGSVFHIHLDMDETFYVVDGEFEIRLGDDVHIVPAGVLAYGPRGIGHSFVNISDKPSTMLCMATPGGIEKFFEELSQLMKAEPRPEWESMRDLANRHRIVSFRPSNGGSPDAALSHLGQEGR